MESDQTAPIGLTIGAVCSGSTQFASILNSSVMLAVILLAFWGYSLCLLNLGINPNKILRLGKISIIGKIQAFFVLGSSLYSAVK